MFHRFSKQRGFALKLMMGVVVVAGLATASLPIYEEMVTKSKMAEAITLAADTKAKLNEFYVFNNRFPRKRTQSVAFATVEIAAAQTMARARVFDFIMEV